jgi:DNA-directed RNA polymerase subunit delta
MKLNKIPKSELELLSYTEIAKIYLEETKKTMTTADLFKEVCNLLELSESDYVDNIADFFQSLTTSKEFILLEDGKWDLKSNHTVKVAMSDIYDDANDEAEQSKSDMEIDDDEDAREPDDFDSIDNSDNYIDDDNDDDLADLTIVNDDDLEE